MEQKRMPISKDFLIQEFQRIADHLEEDTNIYFIGGCALSLLDIKSATYDADIIIETPNEVQKFAEACEKAGYSSKYVLAAEHKFLYPGKVFDNIRTGLHIDVFNKRVVGKLVLSATMKERANKFADVGKLHMYTCSKEDVFLFKSLASVSRTRDVEDLELLYISGLDWKTIQEELTYQSQNFDPTLAVYFIESMDNFQEKKEITIPQKYLKPLLQLAESGQLGQFVRDFVHEGKTDDEILKALNGIYEKDRVLAEIKKQRASLKKD
jgi:hypothetical protein